MSNPPGSSTSIDQSMDLFDDTAEEDVKSPVGIEEIHQDKKDSNEQTSNNISVEVISFQCPFCNEFESDNELCLQLHIQSSHAEDDSRNEETLLSRITDSNAQTFENTTDGHIDVKTVVCPFCDASHEMKESLAEHLTLTHGEELERKDLEELIRGLDYLLCPLCMFTSSTVVGMQQHVDIQHSSKKELHTRHPDDVDYLSNAASAELHVITCPVCGHRESDPDILNSHIEFHFETPNDYGSLQDPSTSKEVEQSSSEHSLSTSSSSSSSVSAVKKVYNKRKQNGYHYKHQYKQGLERAVVKGKMSPADYYDHIAKMHENDLSGADDGHSKVEGLIEQLDSFYNSRSRQGQRVFLCSTTDYYCGSYGDRGWGCGYRNFQMMLSCLNRIHAYSHKISKDGQMRIPSVPKVQEMIEEAWKRGFDREGCLQLEGKLVKTCKWIGATEIVATLSSMGIRCELVEFPHPSSPDGTHPRLIQWVKDYFLKNQNAKPPLYLQHQGHSRTIIGVEVDKDTTRLLLFDPGSTIEHVASLKNSHFSWKQMSSFRRNLAAFKAKQYQIVAISGLLNKEEYERSKRLTSTRILRQT